jgi:hypothetical protein
MEMEQSTGVCSTRQDTVDNARRRAQTLVEWSGSLTGLIGAALLATNSDVSGLGFVAFLLSNACWLAFALYTRAFGLLVMQIGFTVTSVLGIWRWLIA